MSRKGQAGDGALGSHDRPRSARPAHALVGESFNLSGPPQLELNKSKNVPEGGSVDMGSRPPEALGAGPARGDAQGVFPGLHPAPTTAGFST